MKHLFTFFYFLISSLFLFSQNNYKDLMKFLTYHNIGDTIPLYNKSSDFDAHIYIFMDESSCPTCSVSIQPYFENILKKYKVDAELFLSGANEDYAEKLKKEFAWNLDVVIDKIRAFSNLFKIKNYPIFIVADADGKIMTMDKMGGVFIAPEYVEKLIDSSKKARLIEKNLNNMLEEIQRFPVLDNGKPILAGKAIDFFYSDKRKEYYFFLGWNMPLYICDSLGNIKNVVNGFDNKAVSSYYISNLGWIIPDSILVLFESDDSPRRFLASYSINSNKLRFIDYCKLVEKRHGYLWCYIPGTDKFIVTSDFPPNSAKKIEKNTLVHFIYDTTMNLITRFGPIDSIYSNKRISVIFNSYNLTDNHGLIVIYQSFSGKLSFFDTTGRFIKYAFLKYPETYKYIKDDLPEIVSNGYFDSLLYKVSFDNKFLYDCDKDRFAIIYWNYYPAKSFTESLQNKDKYLHICDSNGENVLPQDIKIPENTTVFYISNNIIYASVLNGNKLEIVKYRIKGIKE